MKNQTVKFTLSLIVGMLVSPHPVFATPDPAKEAKEYEDQIIQSLPENLECSAKLSKKNESFKIEKLNTGKPAVSIKDAPHSYVKATDDSILISASNECDNSYRFVFFTDDLKNAQQNAQRKEVTGLLLFWNNFVEGTKTVVVTCK